jgi:hypothetical protein
MIIPIVGLCIRLKIFEHGNVDGSESDFRSRKKGFVYLMPTRKA